NIQSRERDRGHESKRPSARSRHRHHSPTIAERRLGTGLSQLTCNALLRNVRALFRDSRSIHHLGAGRAIDVDAMAASGADVDVAGCPSATPPEPRPPRARGAGAKPLVWRVTLLRK